MNMNHRRFTDLFNQLGLQSDSESVKLFIEKNEHFDASLRLDEAPFWSESQAALLRDEILKDADWAEVVDQLNVALRVRV